MHPDIGLYAAHPYLHDNLPYKPNDLLPIARTTNTIIVIAVPTSLQIGSLADLVALARAQPGKINWAGVTGALDFLTVQHGPCHRAAISPVRESQTARGHKLRACLSSFAPNAKASLHELCRVMGLPGKPQEMDGGEVEKYYRDGRIKEIARAMSLIHTAFGCDMNYFEAG
jgi:hypothetical protein